MNPRQPLIVLLGPTAVGKSQVAVELASRLGTEIISADSRQIYRGMDIGTAKPGLMDRSRVVHHLIDQADPHEIFTAGQFREKAQVIISDLQRQGRIPIVVGGTGLYIKLLVKGLWSGPSANWELRNQLREEESKIGAGTLHRRLCLIDSEAARRINPADLLKIIRAIEVFEETGKPLSSFHAEHQFNDSPYDVIAIGLRRSRLDLYERIEKRIDAMLDSGFLEEVEGLLKQGYSSELSSMKGLGYRQIIGYFNREYDLLEAIRLFKRDTRRYAKRQLTWFNRDESIRWIDLGPSITVEEILQTIIDKIQPTVDSIMGARVAPSAGEAGRSLPVRQAGLG